MVAQLIAFGHRWEEIREYSLNQIQLFLEAGRAVEQRSRAIHVVDAAIAAQADSATIRKHCDSLSREAGK